MTAFQKLNVSALHIILLCFLKCFAETSCFLKCCVFWNVVVFSEMLRFLKHRIFLNIVFTEILSSFFDMSFCCLKHCCVFCCSVKCSVVNCFIFWNAVFCVIFCTHKHTFSLMHTWTYTLTHRIQKEANKKIYTCKYTAKHTWIDMQTFMHMYNKWKYTKALIHTQTHAATLSLSGNETHADQWWKTGQSSSDSAATANK